MLVMVQETADKINKLERQSRYLLHVVTCEAEWIHREPVSKGYPKLALPSGFINKPQHCTRKPPGWNDIMVHPKRQVQGMERDGFTLVDSRQAYDFFPTSFSSGILIAACRLVYSRIWKEHSLVSDISKAICSAR